MTELHWGLLGLVIWVAVDVVLVGVWAVYRSVTGR